MTLTKFLEQVKVLRSAMESGGISGANERRFYLWDTAKLVRIIEIYDGALERIYMANDMRAGERFEALSPLNIKGVAREARAAAGRVAGEE